MHPATKTTLNRWIPTVPRADIALVSSILLVVAGTIIAGYLADTPQGALRRWYWPNLYAMLPLLPLMWMQRPATLPAYTHILQHRQVWKYATGGGLLFGLLDVLVIKGILHPEPYTTLPPFLQPFPYSIFLYTSGAVEVELYYRLLPVTLLLLLHQRLFKARYRHYCIAAAGVITSLIEPLLQWPAGAGWFVSYAVATGIAMNALQYVLFIRFGFLAALWVRLSHYLLWHILLGLYVQYVELA